MTDNRMGGKTVWLLCRTPRGRQELCQAGNRGRTAEETVVWADSFRLYTKKQRLKYDLQHCRGYPRCAWAPPGRWEGDKDL